MNYSIMNSSISWSTCPQFIFLSVGTSKFQNCFESCSINKHVHTPTHLHGHNLDLILTPDDSSVVSNAPRVSHTVNKGAAKWILDSYLLAKAVEHQFECIWCKEKSSHNQAMLQKQIACCNSVVNRDKSNCYRNLVRENTSDSKKLWQVLRSALHTVPETVLPSHDSQKSLANNFVLTFFSDKITKIRDSVFSTDYFTFPAP